MARDPFDGTLDTKNRVNHGLRSTEWDDGHDETVEGSRWGVL